MGKFQVNITAEVTSNLTGEELLRRLVIGLVDEKKFGTIAEGTSKELKVTEYTTVEVAPLEFPKVTLDTAVENINKRLDNE